MSKRIAVLGAGPSGLTAIKSCKEAGLSVVCYERTSAPGGLWRFHEEDMAGVASVMRTTIINTSKEMSAFSDFPPPAHFPNYMHNSKMFEYFMMYAEEFDLLRHIRYNLEVVRVEPAADYDTTGRWTVSVRSTQTEAITREDFDGVMVCVGHHVYPKVPDFPGRERFKGSVTHTHSLKNCDDYKGKTVAVVGIGNSGVDAAVDCTYVADQVYLSTRRGSWIFGRVGPNGLPYDINFSKRSSQLISRLISFDRTCDIIERGLDAKFDHAAYGLKPRHRVLSAHPTMNDALPNCVLSGRVKVKGDIERFEEDGVVFQGDGGRLTPVDAVILATGYHVKFPFLDTKIVPTEDNKISLYKYMIPPNLKHPTLAIIGAIQPLGAIFPISEMQSRWFVHYMSGKLSMPPSEIMKKDINCKNEAVYKRFVESTRHTIQVDWIPFMDELSLMIGAKPNLLKMLFTDPKLALACFNGPCFPYQYRLQGPHAWPGAREAILTFEERIYTPLSPEGRKESIEKKKRHKRAKKRMLLLLVVTLTGVFYGRKYLEEFVPLNF